MLDDRSTLNPRERASVRPEMKESSMPPPPIDRFKIGRYEVIYPLASGGMATVHLGRLAGLAGFERLVAIKIIHPHLVNKEMFVKMFLDEARLAAQIHHPNVGEILEVGEDDGLLYMVAEYIEGKNLSKLAVRAQKRHRTLSLPLCSHIMAQVCRGLHSAHELEDPDSAPLNLVHRDVSPQNIMISYSGNVKLIDFGVVHAQGRLSHTEIGLVKGKAGFMPPEYIKGEVLDRRSDIFASGVTLYLLSTGSLPFEGANEAQRVDKILRGDFPLPSKLNPRIPSELEKIILRAMESNVNKRYQTSAQMAYDLEGFSSSEGDGNYSDDLEALMHELFVDDLNKHKELIKEHRRFMGEDSAMIDMKKLDAKSKTHTMSNGQDESVEDITLDVTLASPIARKRHSRQKRKEILKIAGIASIGIVAAAILFVLVVVGPINEQAEQESHQIGSSSGVNQQSKGNHISPMKDAAVAGSPIGTLPRLTAEKNVSLEGDLTSVFHDESNGIQKDEPTVPRKNMVVITVTISEPESVVLLDGTPLEGDISKFELPADKEKHQITVSKKGFATETIHFIADVDKALHIDLIQATPKRKNWKKKQRKPKATLQGSPYR